MAAQAKAMASRIADSRQRKRLRCTSATTYDHANLVDYIQGALPAGWTAYGPGGACEGPDPPAAPTQYPPVNDEATQVRCTRCLLLAHLY